MRKYSWIKAFIHRWQAYLSNETFPSLLDSLFRELEHIKDGPVPRDQKCSILNNIGSHKVKDYRVKF